MRITPFKLFSWQGKTKILHMSWMAFFVSFVVWFNHAPLMVLIKQDLAITDREVEIILLLNVALTIPARVIIGMVVDRFGAKISYSVLLAASSLPCFMFAMADNFAELAWSRFLLGFIGAGFVVGVRIIGDWFPANQIGTAEGIYAGWGNFGSAAAAIFLPGLAYYFGAGHGWRLAVAGTGGIGADFCRGLLPQRRESAQRINRTKKQTRLHHGGEQHRRFIPLYVESDPPLRHHDPFNLEALQSRISANPDGVGDRGACGGLAGVFRACPSIGQCQCVASDPAYPQQFIITVTGRCLFWRLPI